MEALQLPPALEAADIAAANGLLELANPSRMIGCDMALCEFYGEEAVVTVANPVGTNQYSNRPYRLVGSCKKHATATSNFRTIIDCKDCRLEFSICHCVTIKTRQECPCRDQEGRSRGRLYFTTEKDVFIHSMYHGRSAVKIRTSHLRIGFVKIKKSMQLHESLRRRHRS